MRFALFCFCLTTDFSDFYDFGQFLFFSISAFYNVFVWGKLEFQHSADLKNKIVVSFGVMSGGHFGLSW